MTMEKQIARNPTDTTNAFVMLPSLFAYLLNTLEFSLVSNPDPPKEGCEIHLLLWILLKCLLFKVHLTTNVSGWL